MLNTANEPAQVTKGNVCDDGFDNSFNFIRKLGLVIQIAIWMDGWCIRMRRISMYWNEILYHVQDNLEI